MDDRAQTTPSLPGQVVLVFQGGGALGAYQGGVYQALHEAGIEPNWVIGTSIGAINGAIIAGNEPGKRLNKVSKFWDRMERKPIWGQGPLALMGGNAAAQMMTIFGGIAGYFTPNRDLAWGLHAPIGVERAGFYTIEALHETLNGVVDFSHIVRLKAPRLDHEDHLRDIDFTSAGIHARWQAGFADTTRMLERRPWEAPIDPMAGVAVHDSDIQS